MSELFCYLVSYDIRDEKRLQKVHKSMLGFGEPVHYSVFRCDLTAKGRAEMVEALRELIEDVRDRVMIVNLGPSLADWEDKVEFLGEDRKDFSSRNSIVV